MMMLTMVAAVSLLGVASVVEGRMFGVGGGFVDHVAEKKK